MRTLSRKKQRQLFLVQATKLLLDLGAKQDGGETYGFTLQTKAGRLRLQPDADQQDGPGTVFTCFDDPQAARQFVDCNRFSGKWNFHYFDGSVESLNPNQVILDLSFYVDKLLHWEPVAV